jgi:hypothetical protein
LEALAKAAETRLPKPEFNLPVVGQAPEPVAPAEPAAPANAEEVPVEQPVEPAISEPETTENMKPETTELSDDAAEAMRDIIQMKKSKGEKPSDDMVSRLAKYDARKSGVQIEQGDVVSNIVVGHPMFEPPQPELRNLIPIKIKSKDQASGSIDRALKLKAKTLEYIGGYQYNKSKAKAPAQKKQFAKQFNSIELNRQEEILRYLNDDVFPELERIEKLAPESQPATVEPMAEQPTEEMKTTEETPTARDATKPEQMTEDELALFKKAEAIKSATDDLSKAKDGTDKPYSFGFKSKAALVRAREDALKKATSEGQAPDVFGTVVDAANQKRPIFTGLVDSLSDADQTLSPGPAGEPGGIVRSARKQLIDSIESKGYVKEGELYVFKGEEAPAAEAPAEKPVKAKQPKPTKSDAVQEPAAKQAEEVKGEAPKEETATELYARLVREKVSAIEKEIAEIKKGRNNPKSKWYNASKSEIEKREKKIENTKKGGWDTAVEALNVEFGAKRPVPKVWDDLLAQLRFEPGELRRRAEKAGYVKQGGAYVFDEKPAPEPQLAPKQQDVVVFMEDQNDQQEERQKPKKKRITPGEARKAGTVEILNRLGIQSNNPKSVILSLIHI